MTNEDFLPVIEIDETYPSSLHTDYHWLMKVSQHSVKTEFIFIKNVEKMKVDSLDID